MRFGVLEEFLGWWSGLGLKYGMGTMKRNEESAGGVKEPIQRDK